MTLNMVSSGSSKSSIILVLIAVQVLISCQHRENEQTIRVAAAASTKFALDSLILNFERSQPYQCRVSYASSGLLTSQIAEGAPFDIFLSADETYGQHLHEAQIAQPPIRYAQAMQKLKLETPRPSENEKNCCAESQGCTVRLGRQGGFGKHGPL